MRLFRNSEIRNNVLWFFLIALAATITAFIWRAAFGLFTLGLCTILIVLYLSLTYNRYRRISDLSESIDKILHGNNNITFEHYAEGELSILQIELQKMTIRLREQQQQLQKDKQYLREAIADISHQIRTPLTAIHLLVSLLSEPDLVEERRLTLTRELLDQLSRIDWLITTLLKISKLDAQAVHFQKNTVSLTELIDKALSPLLIPIELRRQELILHTEGSFTGDIAWTCEALGNVIKNCMEHTPEGGSITINARETALYTEIILSDSGCGFTQEDLPHIFERFYKGKRTDKQSYGIGLALTHMIVRAQNGTIKAENLPSGGAVFTIRFFKGTV